MIKMSRVQLHFFFASLASSCSADKPHWNATIEAELLVAIQTKPISEGNTQAADHILPGIYRRTHSMRLMEAMRLERGGSRQATEVQVVMSAMAATTTNASTANKDGNNLFSRLWTPSSKRSIADEGTARSFHRIKGSFSMTRKRKSKKNKKIQQDDATPTETGGGKTRVRVIYNADTATAATTMSTEADTASSSEASGAKAAPTATVAVSNKRKVAQTVLKNLVGGGGGGAAKVRNTNPPQGISVTTDVSYEDSSCSMGLSSSSGSSWGSSYSDDDDESDDREGEDDEFDSESSFDDDEDSFFWGSRGSSESMSVAEDAKTVVATPAAAAGVGPATAAQAAGNDTEVKSILTPQSGVPRPGSFFSTLVRGTCMCLANDDDATNLMIPSATYSSYSSSSSGSSSSWSSSELASSEIESVEKQNNIPKTPKSADV